MLLEDFSLMMKSIPQKESLINMTVHCVYSSNQKAQSLIAFPLEQDEGDACETNPTEKKRCLEGVLAIDQI